MTDFATFFVYLYEKQWLKFYYKRWTNKKIKIKKSCVPFKQAFKQINTRL